MASNNNKVWKSGAQEDGRSPQQQQAVSANNSSSRALTSSLSVAPSQCSSLFSRLSLSKLSPSRLLTGWPHKFLVNVQLLDDGKTVSEVFKKESTGRDVLDYVCKCLDIVEKEYFGLRYQHQDNHRYWLDLSKPLHKQFRVNNLALSFRVRFYPENPAFCLREEITRYQLFVQLQRDLLHGRLHLPQMDAAFLAGLILQSVLGDYDEELMGGGSDYVSEYKLLLRQSQRLEELSAQAHQTYRGMRPAEAEAEFLKIACRAETYGFDPYGLKDMKQAQEITIGTTVHGILVFVNNHKIHTMKWREIQKVDYVGKRLQIYPTKHYFASYLQSALNGDHERNNLTLLNLSMNQSSADDADKKMRLKFTCPSGTFAKHLWRHILSQQVFFTEEQARFVKPQFSKPRIPLFSRGSTFRCPASRVMHEIQQDALAPRPSISFQRYTLARQKARSEEEPWNLAHTPALPQTSSSSSSTLATAIGGDASMTGASTPRGSSSSTPAAGDKEQQTANCILESALDGLQTGHSIGAELMEGEHPLPECSSVHEEIDGGPGIRRQAFQQQQNGGVTSKEIADVLSFNARDIILNCGSRDKKKQMDLAEARTVSSGLSSGFLFSMSLCLLITLCAFLCYHYKWVPAAARYYNGLK